MFSRYACFAIVIPKSLIAVLDLPQKLVGIVIAPEETPAKPLTAESLSEITPVAD
jgi:hypothetical protein